MKNKRFKRRILPFDDLYVNVDLYSVFQEWGNNPAPCTHVQPIADWIADGRIELIAVSPYHVLSEADRPLVYDRGIQSRMSGATPKHRELCALGAIYLLSLGKEVDVGGVSDCTYAGGWSDVAAKDGSIFVECGTLRANKPILAMRAGQTLMVLPYAPGGVTNATTDAELSAILPPYELAPLRLEEGLSEEVRERRLIHERARRLTQPSASLGYVFVPSASCASPA